MSEKGNVGTENAVRIAVGAGNEPIVIGWQEDDTVESVLQRAQVELKTGQTATLGKRRVKNPAKTKVKAGDLIVIAGKPANG